MVESLWRLDARVIVHVSVTHGYYTLKLQMKRGHLVFDVNETENSDRLFTLVLVNFMLPSKIISQRLRQ